MPTPAREMVISKFDALIADLTRALEPTGILRGDFQRRPSSAEVSRIRTEALNLTKRLVGPEGDHYKSILATDMDKNYEDNAVLLGIIRAAKNDFEHGFLFDLRSLIAAEMLGDFTEQAEVLLGAGYQNPAASLVGAVLEDALRRLSDKHAVPHPPRTKLEALNVGLAKAGVYDKLVQKRITGIGDIATTLTMVTSTSSEEKMWGICSRTRGVSWRIT